MNKATAIFRVDAILLALFLLALLLVWPEIITHSFVHVIPGLLLLGVVVVHLYLHRRWIETVYRNYHQMGRRARNKALLNLALLSAYLVAGSVGAAARLMLYLSPAVHFHLGVWHVILVVPLIVLQTAHLALHFGWIKKNVRARIFTRISDRPVNT